ncbi:AraC family transcriptional regulator [Caldimonas thermodepolymerans]|uniref:AraC family transcriptional regulator n=1 Tax=Caldimonas thermodepolymerans TaxID=215580 RepID=UPI002235BA16|nr:AraC family transcriptional regulator [Caldimonas thermodepolymerans]UZG43975.1 AraC family transcriptional regulator [Caldimonas thermodepolymerans]
MDALSDLLRVLHFAGGVFLEACFRQPWCVTSRLTAEDCGPDLAAPGGLVAFHFVLDGKMEVALPDGQRCTARAGDLVLLPGNDPHLLASDLRLPPVSADALIEQADAQAMARIDHGDGPEVLTRLVCGYLATPVVHHPQLAMLPPLMVEPMAGRPCADWVASSFRYASQERASLRPGAQAVIGRLSELLFVEAVRSHVERLPAQERGWLAALRDPPLARTLAALHARVAHPWTTESLAREALLSRSAFADRFTRVLGMPPMTYLTRWRMCVAARRLRESSQPIARIAAEVGYESESTFSRAFTREMGTAPGAFRREDRMRDLQGLQTAAAAPAHDEGFPLYRTKREQTFRYPPTRE